MTNSELLTRRQTAVVRGVSQATPVFAERALNSEIWDVEGKRYVDFAGGIAVLNTGHCHPRIVAAIREQLDRFTHTCFQVAPYEGYIRLAERLNQLAPINGPLKSILLSTGAEATENAVKIARAATGRSGVIAFTGGFHGRTAFASAMTGKVIPYKKALGPPLPGVWHVPFPVAGSDVSVEDALRCVQFVFKADIDASQVAAIIIEPVQGEGGFHQAPPELMRGLRRLCDENGIVLIADEVQTGFGRTGKMFAMEHYDVQADIVCVAKSLAGGLPLSGVIGRAAIMDAAEPGGLGGTYAGNPLACAAALAVLDVFEEENLIARANQIGERLRSAIDRFALSNTLVPTSVARGPGAMVAFDILKQRGSNEPDAEATKRVTRLAHENGLILLSCGTAANTIRILVPLTASDAIVDEGLAILERCLAA
ncbi:4-aminobutyrate--2-oxoglutarate transaminase [Rhodopseudomonas palustris]|uniref:4-aminobutyrate aminotransferase n=1 Tax=Rhodopseudomonas palustris (strain ATCC BAA-98 / CGA009) TaxID=258594 RepID=Q6N7D5_RHOPA|nr:4-aminobutyrate--2-oxoglutarate transaminase [Rhodopseudomonas palustris]OPF90406.1 4-aminobutyrate transaminase [Rhodopseudomonas palustris]PPQ41461.1 4-aminobutyrate--2-oxoglutarate transaminase [Rhodopseudomonas palustris]QLH71351.1 4-aminobutyrate--2-oxoglutarate transaminase [Rhodopseudomonas palustris]QQM03844.1 5-aminovalerate aminotransferase DavT [Rhodopseudomonas palustris]RIA03604.1 4-aminobutyrate--2-oxoglutarate transaminase [Rhodopseudomonas palustris]